MERMILCKNFPEDQIPHSNHSINEIRHIKTFKDMILLTETHKLLKDRRKTQWKGILTLQINVTCINSINNFQKDDLQEVLMGLKSVIM